MTKTNQKTLIGIGILAVVVSVIAYWQFIYCPNKFYTLANEELENYKHCISDSDCKIVGCGQCVNLEGTSKYDNLKSFCFGEPPWKCLIPEGCSCVNNTCVEKSNSVSTSSFTPFFPTQKKPATSVMQALLSDKPEELELVDGCLRVNNGYDNYLIVWPYGFSLRTDKDGVIQVIDDTGQPVVHVGDKVRFGGGGGEMSGGDSGDVSAVSTQLPSDRCSGPYWILGEIIGITDDKPSNPDCVSDEDCIKVQKGCCPCSSGGELVCMSKDMGDKYMRELDEGCKDINCSDWYRCDEFENLKCKCINNACIAVKEEGKPEIR